MTQNIGALDKVIRVLIGLAVIGAGTVTGSAWGLLGGLLVLTAFIGWCAPYALFGINTCGPCREAQEEKDG